MSSPGDEGGFKVTDRRRRAEGPVEPAREVLQGSAPTPPVTLEPSGHQAGPRAAPSEGRSLVALFVMLGSTGAMALGSPDPVTGETHRDAVQAAEMIDLLSLLRERTEGNRTLEETQVLDELIYDLQLRYVEVMKRSG